MAGNRSGSAIYYGSRRPRRGHSPLPWILLAFLVFFLGAFAAYGSYYIWNKKPVLTLNGESEMTVEVGAVFQDPGASAMVGDDTDLSDQLRTDGTVNTEAPADYQLTYSLTYRKSDYQISRMVHVRDTKAPVLTLKDAEEEFIVSDFAAFKEPGYTAEDAYEGDVTGEVEITHETLDDESVVIHYTVADSSGNTAKAERYVIVRDQVPPEVTLNGEETITLRYGASFEDPGATAVDDKDGDISASVTVEGEVDTKTAGTYERTYSATDSAGNTASVTRTVVVQKKEDNDSVIYLTFDDGPSSKVTPQILDILEANDVQATFFILRYSEGMIPTLKRMIDDGDTIGLHAWDHDYAVAYGSMDSYYEGLLKLQKKIEEDTGYHAFCCRFPGGSSNTISKRYTEGVITHLAQVLTDAGIDYYDWNVDSTDAEGNNRPVETLVANVTGSLKKGRANVVLCHDTNAKETTAQALQQIIDYGKANGYTFKAISKDTPAVHHSINN